jgi:hypothetical protein
MDTNALKNYREQWEDITETSSLLEINVSVGLLLHDICDALGFTPNQRREVLGAELEAELQEFLDIRITAQSESIAV